MPSSLDVGDSKQIGFTPDDEVRVHEEGAIRLICTQFRSHEDGLPEWIKNSSDQYRRLDLTPSESVIATLFRDGRRSRPSLIGVLDFGGMSVKDVEGKFRNWADPEAAGSTMTADVEGGHGNGGKCYMTQMFESHSFLHTLLDGQACKYGFVARSYKPGYFPSADEGRGYSVPMPDDELNSALSLFDLNIQDLPDEAISVWKKRQAFTLFVGVHAKGFAKTLPVTDWINSLCGHPQTVRAVDTNKIFIVHNGKLFNQGVALALPEIKPIPGSGEARVVKVPATLRDPSTNDEVKTKAHEDCRLILQTSEKSMRWSLKARHTVNGRTTAGRATGFWEVPDLSRAPYSNQIFGDLFLDELEKFKQNDRRNHTNAPLTRAIKEWLTNQIDAYSAEFVKLERLETSKEERDQLSRMNEALNQWKNAFLEQELGRLGGDESGRSTRDQPPKPRLPIGKPNHLLLTLTHEKAGRGITFRPSLEFFDSEGTRIRAVPYQWESSDWSVATVDEKLNLITTHTAGHTTIVARCMDSELCSNDAPLEVIDIEDIELSPRELEIASGSRSPITAVVNSRDGRKIEGAYLVWTGGNDAVVSVGSGGMVFGLEPGESEVYAGDDYVISRLPAKVTVNEGGSGDKGRSYPKILLSEIDDDPLGDQPPIFTSAHPPVYQRPQDFDYNIWWINMASPLARRYVDSTAGSGAHSREWRVYLLERYIEILVKIFLTYNYEQGEELTFETMLHRWDEQAVAMQERASETLREFLNEGVLPE